MTQISENAKKAKQKPMKACVNQGFCLLGGIHSIVIALLPERASIILHAHSSKALLQQSKYSNSMNFNDIPFPELLLYSVTTNGFDTDTVGAISGYMLGARFGRSSWMLHQSCLVDFERIEQYGKKIAQLWNLKNEFHQEVVMSSSSTTSIRSINSKNNNSINNLLNTIESLEEYLNQERLLSVYCSIQRHQIMDLYVPIYRRVNRSTALLNNSLQQENTFEEEMVISRRTDYHSLSNVHSFLSIDRTINEKYYCLNI